MARVLADGWQIIGRTPIRGELQTCYFCSSKRPKFRGGWDIRLSDGTRVTVGPHCGAKHLGDTFTIHTREIQREEKRKALHLDRDQWLTHAPSYIKAADAILAHEGLARLKDIRDRTLLLSTRARRHLERISSGAVASIPAQIVFEPLGPRRLANDIKSALAALDRVNEDLNDLATQLRTLRRAVEDINRAAPAYRRGIAIFDKAMIVKISESLPEVSWQLEDGMLVMRRASDATTYRLALPADLSFAGMEVPDWPTYGADASNDA